MTPCVLGESEHLVGWVGTLHSNPSAEIHFLALLSLRTRSLAKGVLPESSCLGWGHRLKFQRRHQLLQSPLLLARIPDRSQSRSRHRCLAPDCIDTYQSVQRVYWFAGLSIQ